MALSDDERARLAAKYESSAWKLPLPSHPMLRSPRAGVWAVVLVVFCWLVATTRIPLQRCDDIYVYVGARSLASGQGYSDISRPDKPPQLKYPPLRALLQVPFLPLLKENTRPLRLVSIVFFAGLLPIVYALVQPTAGHRAALWAILLGGLSPMTARMANYDGNLGIVAFLWVLCFWLAERVRRKDANLRDEVFLGLGLAAAFYAHRMAVMLIPTTALFLVFAGRRRGAMVSLGLACALAAPWIWRSWSLSGHWISPEYEFEIKDRIRTETGSTVTYMLGQALVFPTEMGYGVLPWWKASGGATWPFLIRSGVGWVGPLGAWLLACLLVLGWGHSLKRGGLAEWYFPAHTLMLLGFFVGFQYYLMLFPWLFLWLWRGLSLAARARLPRTAILLTASLVLLVNVAKGVRAFLLFPTSPMDRNGRWAWVPNVVPDGATVYYVGLENYALAPLRWFDTNRMALGITEETLDDVLAGGHREIIWLCLDRRHPKVQKLKAAGWRPEVVESFTMPTPEMLIDLSDAQQNYVRLLEPPQSLWRRPD
jgi:4-amino-4-deoxy-L-arabinose transferase-like glycosyltransferase